MWKQKLGMSTLCGLDVPMDEQIRLIKAAGFDAVSPAWTQDDTWKTAVLTAREVGLSLQFLHAPYGGAADMWSADEARGEAALKELLHVLRDCAEYQIPILVVHTYIGFEPSAGPTAQGLERYGRLVQAAGECGVSIAFENTEGEEYLFALMQHFEGNGTVGFCWDSGHEMCYNHSKDLLARLGDRLMVTHLNDNLGISRFDGSIFWTDDLHLLPFDGIADWEDIGRRLKQCPALEILNFELDIRGKPNRHESDIYAAMEPSVYLAECYKRACRVAQKIR